MTTNNDYSKAVLMDTFTDDEVFIQRYIEVPMDDAALALFQHCIETGNDPSIYFGEDIIFV